MSRGRANAAIGVLLAGCAAGASAEAPAAHQSATAASASTASTARVSAQVRSAERAPSLAETAAPKPPPTRTDPAFTACADECDRIARKCKAKANDEWKALRACNDVRVECRATCDRAPR